MARVRGAYIPLLTTVDGFSARKTAKEIFNKCSRATTTENYVVHLAPGWKFGSEAQIIPNGHSFFIKIIPQLRALCILDQNMHTLEGRDRIAYLRACEHVQLLHTQLRDIGWTITTMSNSNGLNRHEDCWKYTSDTTNRTVWLQWSLDYQPIPADEEQAANDLERMRRLY